jgi:hypothetical protein
MTQSDTGLTERSSEVASSTKQHASDVASTATDQARDVASEAKQQGRDLLHQARSTVRGQAAGQKDRAAGQLRSVADQLRTMQEGGGAPSGPASEIVRQASQQTERLAGWLEDREPADILDDARNFARQRPGIFLLSCLAAGFVVGRLVKGARSDDSSSRASQYRTYPSSTLTGDYSGATTVGSDLGTGTGSTYATTGAYGAGGAAASQAYETTPVYDDTSTTYAADTGAAEDAVTSTATYADESTGDPWQDDDTRRSSSSGGSGV